MSPLPRPKSTDLAGFFDLDIKSVALAVDSSIGSAVKLAVVGPTSYTTNANGDVTVAFAGLTTITGCLIYGTGTVYGKVRTLPPVPPASIGRTLLATAAVPVPIQLNTDGTVWVRIMTTPQSLSPQSGVPQFYGTQPADTGQSVQLYGIAWGPA